MDKAGAVLEKLERRREASARKGGVVKGRSVSVSFFSFFFLDEGEGRGRGRRLMMVGGDRRIGII